MKRLCIFLLSAIVLALIVLLGLQFWISKQVQQGFVDFYSEQESQYLQGHERLLTLAKVRPKKILEELIRAANENGPGPDEENRSIQGDQVFWKCIVLLGDIGNPEAIPALVEWLRWDDLNSFPQCVLALIRIEQDNPGDSRCKDVFAEITRATLASRMSGNTEAGLGELSRVGTGDTGTAIAHWLPSCNDAGLTRQALSAMEGIAKRGFEFDVSSFMDHENVYIRTVLARIHCWMGQADGLAVMAGVLRSRARIQDERAVDVAAMSFDIFTERVLNYCRTDSEAVKNVKIEKYLRLVDDAGGDAKQVYRKPRK